MKKIILTTLLSATLCSNAFAAEPSELARKVQQENPSIITNDLRYSSSRMMSPQGYTIDILAVSDPSKKDKYDRLEIVFHDKEMRFEIVDKEANGLSKGDSFQLTRHYSDGDTIDIYAKYLGSRNYDISGMIFNGTNIYYTEKKDTSKIEFYKKIPIDVVTAPTVEWGKREYCKVITALIDRNDKAIPYTKLKRALTKLGKEIPVIKEDREKGKKNIGEIIGEYAKAIYLDFIRKHDATKNSALTENATTNQLVNAE